MFAMNKETMMMVSIAVALIAVFYLFRENQKTKLDIKSLKDVPVQLPVNQQAVITPPKPILKKEKVQVPATSTTAAIADDSEQ